MPKLNSISRFDAYEKTVSLKKNQVPETIRPKTAVEKWQEIHGVEYSYSEPNTCPVEQEEIGIENLPKQVKMYPDLATFFKLKILELYLIETIHILSTGNSPIPGWCLMNKKHLGDCLQMSERSMFIMIRKLEKAGMLEKRQKHFGNCLRPTLKYKDKYSEIETQRKQFMKNRFNELKHKYKRQKHLHE